MDSQMTDTTGVIVLLVAAGRGLRAGGDLPKQYQNLLGRPVMAWTLDAVRAALPDCRVQLVIHPDDAELYEQVIDSLPHPPNLLPWVAGGASRQASVRAGLAAIGDLCKDAKYVLIHDVARPFLYSTLTSRLISKLLNYKSVIPCLTIYDAVKRIDPEGRLLEDIDRAQLRRIQTPQAFAFDLISSAHQQAYTAGHDDFPDDAAVLQWAGHPVHVCEGEADNMKLTTAEDFARAESQLLNQRADIRIGQGFDVHAFGEGDHVWLGGVKIPHSRAMVGHSDADVVLHALTDAILGALCDGDIGQHFPPSDPQWKGARSDIFLKDALRRVVLRQGLVAHLDVTIICEAPKISPHRETIRAQIAQICALPLDRISVKATTTEQLGFTGRKEGIAAMALATIRLPSSPLTA